MNYVDNGDVTEPQLTPTSLLVFAGRRLWPQVDALAQWGDSLTRVHIVGYDGLEGPGGPADRLAHFIAVSLPHLLVTSESVAADDPGDVLDVLKRIDSQSTKTDDGPNTEPGSVGLLVDASGMTRLASHAVSQFLARREHVPVIYRSASGPWHRLLPEGRIARVGGTRPDAIDRFTVADLLALTWSDAERSARVKPIEIAPEVEAAATRAIAGADWEGSFLAALRTVSGRSPTRVAQGPLFESFVVSMVRQFGVQADDVAISAMLFDGHRAVQEVDVVVNASGRLHVIDCKLIEEERALPIGEQIRSAFTTREHLGDGADQVILLRPNMVFDDEFLSLSAQYGIEVVDKAVLSESPLPDVLRELLLGPPREAPGPSPHLRPTVRVPVRGRVVDLRAEFVQSREPVRLYDFDQYIVLVAHTDKSDNTDELARQLELVLGGAGQVLARRRNQTRNRFTALIQTSLSEPAAALSALTGFRFRM